VSLPLFSPYSCSKFAVEALSDSLRYELAPQGIKVVLLKPGAVKTPIWDKSLEASEVVVGSLSEEAKQHYGDIIKQVRGGVVAARPGAPACWRLRGGVLPGVCLQLLPVSGCMHSMWVACGQILHG
jgi:NAD(P)-dependent dehydrogenase (short-subunit alcohol dehydrogenase family)